MPLAVAPAPPEPDAAAPAQVGGAPEAADSVGAAERDLRARAKERIDAGDYAGARAILDDMLTLLPLAEARALIDGGRAREALVVTEGLLAIAPSEPRVLAAHGEASLRTGVERSDRAQVEVGLRAFVQAGDSPVALLGASRAARWLGQIDEAVRYAREGLATWRETPAPERTRLDEAPERTLAEALVAAWSVAEAESDASRELAAEAERALAAATEVSPADAWAWIAWVDLLARTDRATEALAVLERALQAVPRERKLYDSLARIVRERDGRTAAIDALERVARSNPASGLARERAANELLEGALDRLGQGTLEEFRAAEIGFARARRLEPMLRAACLESEARCRTGAGWCLLGRGEIDAALAAFRSTEDLYAGALRAHVEGRLRSGVDGLAAAGQALAERDQPNAAGGVFLDLHRREPGELEWALRAGRSMRDAGERTELTSRDCLLAADGKLTDARRLAELRERVGIEAGPLHAAELRLAFRRAGEHRALRAREMFEASYRAYADAAALAPSDLRVLNACAQVAVNHLGEDLERAEAMLQRAVTLGAEALADPNLTAEREADLREAWGDAHQILGKLYLERFDRPDRAERWFTKAVEIGPYPRPEVTDYYLPRCAELNRTRK